MGKIQKKTGKGRLDKYYKLAKEQGYRARSAFKLIQLNKKYSFLESSRCTIDLCAAPGGWLQVASKYMPSNSVIIGVDLVPIKPIPRVVSFVADITTPKCRNIIRTELKDWKADVVLHDGAPNVGTAWIQDAYSQSELVLMSLKLAVEFLVKGGTFVTKVFRSVDYNNLIWVFNQLFGKVEATKPPSSRNVSAEIFVVCRDFRAPSYIDPKFLDPKHVFKDLASTIASEPNVTMGTAQANVFHPEKKRRHREGYNDGDYTLFRAITASSFIRGDDPISALGASSKITFSTQEEKEWLSMDLATEDVKANCDDLKVLGKGDFKALIKWRLALREEIGIDMKAKSMQDIVEQVDITDKVDEDQLISAELERLNTEAAARAKRERRKANEIKQKTIQRMQLQMTAPIEIGLEQRDLALHNGQDDMFDLGRAEHNRLTDQNSSHAFDDTGDAVMEHFTEDVRGNLEDELLSSEEEMASKLMRLDVELEGLYDIYKGRLRERDAKFKVHEARRKNVEREEWNGIFAEETEVDSEVEGGWEKMQMAKIGDQDSSSEDESFEGAYIQENASNRASQLWFSQDIFSEVNRLDRKKLKIAKISQFEISEVQSAKSMEDDQGEFEVVLKEDLDGTDLWDKNENDGGVVVKTDNRITPEGVTLAQQLINREKTKTQLISDGFNRYSLNSKEDLPSWFLDDEARNYKPNIPVTKEAMAALKARQRALDARPIKKVAEAKARKKYKAAQQLEKALKKAEGINATTDMSEQEKSKQIDKLMRKGTSAAKKAKKDIKVVVAKGAYKGLKGRPNGIKGRYTMVDSRMKKEIRAKKRKEKASRKR